MGILRALLFVCLSVCLFGTTLLRNCWTALAEIFHRDGGLPGDRHAYCLAYILQIAVPSWLNLGHNAHARPQCILAYRHWQLRDTGLLVLTMWSVHRPYGIRPNATALPLIANEYETSLAHVPQTGGALWRMRWNKLMVVDFRKPHFRLSTLQLVAP